ncbi:MAG: peptidylprolyl isomerase [candidate division KSB1 bacterium]|nr:peptidylprolyl isomerase [candidate division KSB1 bacterium]
MRQIVCTGIFIFFLLLSFRTDFASGKLLNPEDSRMWVKVNSENLRLTPNGEILGQLTKGTELEVLEKQGKWVRVQLTGWMWEASLTADKDEILGPRYRALHIVVPTRTQAEEALNQIRGGTDFSELAKKISIGPEASKGGDLGYFRKGDFLPEFENAIFKLKPGEVSDIVEMKFKGNTLYHIFKRIQ